MKPDLSPGPTRGCPASTRGRGMDQRQLPRWVILLPRITPGTI